MGGDHFDFWFDFVDPGSYLAHELLRRWRGDAPDPRARMRPLELRPPPEPLLSSRDARWRELLGALGEIARSEAIPFSPPNLVPWTRKAHELALHGEEKGVRIHDVIFRAHFEEGLDLGRVDVLVRLAEQAGLDGAEARTVLGVDRFAPSVEEGRREAAGKGIRGVPSLLAGGRRLEGFRTPAELRDFAELAELV